jgi:hypothetical protein
MMERFRRGLRIIDEFDVFIASFFDSGVVLGGRDPGDVLNQWQAYSQGHSGFSIGFDKARLSEHISKMESKSRLIYCGPCNYDENTQEEQIQQRMTRFGSSILEELFSVIDNWAKENAPAVLEPLRRVVGQPSEAETEELIEAVASRMSESMEPLKEMMLKEFARADREIILRLTKIMIPLAFFKHPSFAAENEWRIVQFGFRPRAKVRFRPGPSSIIPYLDIELPLDDPDNDLIKRIVVGPSPKIEEAVSATKMLLRCKGLRLREYGSKTGIEVVPSQLPFRRW